LNSSPSVDICIGLVPATPPLFKIMMLVVVVVVASQKKEDVAKHNNIVHYTCTRGRMKRLKAFRLGHINKAVHN
jgi:hypothetical protein